MGLFAYSSSIAAFRWAVVMAAAIVLNLLVAAVGGGPGRCRSSCRRLGRDPAQGSSVLLTFSTDGMGFLIFLGLAHVVSRVRALLRWLTTGGT